MSWQHLNQPQGWIGVISLSLSLSLSALTAIVDQKAKRTRSLLIYKTHKSTTECFVWYIHLCVHQCGVYKHGLHCMCRSDVLQLACMPGRATEAGYVEDGDPWAACNGSAELWHVVPACG